MSNQPFLNDFLEEEVYIEQSMSYEVNGHEQDFKVK